MIWRPFSPSGSPFFWNISRIRATSHTPYLFSRGILSRPAPNIATVLATPPSHDPQIDQDITITGFVRTVRNQKARSFVEIGDGSTIHSLQAVLDPCQAKGLATGTSVRLGGKWQLAPANKEQEYELKANEVTIVGVTDPEIYPIQKKYQSAEYLRTIPHLRLRIPFNALLARLRSECDFHFSTFFHDLNFVRVQPPIITSSDCEGAGEVFTVSSDPTLKGLDMSGHSSEPEKDHFFRQPKFLTVSSQLHLEAFVHEHQKVWSLSPTFRAEKSDTPRHLSEFWMLEVEIQTGKLGDIMDLVEDMIKSLASYLHKSKLMNEIISSKRMGHSEKTVSPDPSADLITKRWEGLIRNTWPRITYDEVIEQLEHAVESNQVAFEHRPSWAGGLQLEHEKFIATHFGRGSPVFVTNYPQDIKPFYMSPSETTSGLDSSATAACFDLLLPDVCEVAGGSLREHRLDHLIKSMHKHGLMKKTEISASENIENQSLLRVDGHLDWYLSLRRFGSVPHGGFGLGFDRLISYLAGVYSVKDVTPWPRWYNRCDC